MARITSSVLILVFTLRGARGDTLVPAPVVPDEAKERAS
jgi:hypothetical protein